MKTVIKWHKIKTEKDNPRIPGTYMVAIAVKRGDAAHEENVIDTAYYHGENLWSLKQIYASFENIHIAFWAPYPVFSVGKRGRKKI